MMINVSMLVYLSTAVKYKWVVCLLVRMSVKKGFCVSVIRLFDLYMLISFSFRYFSGNMFPFFSHLIFFV